MTTLDPTRRYATAMATRYGRPVADSRGRYREHETVHVIEETWTGEQPAPALTLGHTLCGKKITVASQYAAEQWERLTTQYACTRCLQELAKEGT